MPRYQFDKPGARAELLDELGAAGIATERLEMDEMRVWVTSTAAKAAVQSVIDAHNPAAYDAEGAAQVTKFDQAVAFLKTFYTTPNAQLTADQMKNAIKALSVVARKHDQALALDDG